ncbi:MAG: hydroxyethylthiazole kinase [Clostridiaceae bacterium]|jgi:hydroxyethylthiazole kinase|nr:hydroxyethylthiazole kinase [Bacillota bacterium]NLN51411.1 hydroxyethylthiazole kinase [Clostridiaceae bacterium]
MNKLMKTIFNNVREKNPLIHNITNYVTVNDVANALLACGGSPIMADEPAEVEDITSICGGLNLNIGTLNSRTIQAMLLAGKKSNELKHIVLLDPVGAGASPLRTDTALKIMQEIELDAIRGNISEIKTLHAGSGTTEGVDASEVDAINEENLNQAVLMCKEFAQTTGSIIIITGAIDLVSDKNKCYVIRNGRPEMPRITGTGCQLSGLTTAFLVANPEHKLEAAATAVCLMGLAGEIGHANLLTGDGNSTYRNRIIDAIYNMTAEQLIEGANYELK